MATKREDVRYRLMLNEHDLRAMLDDPTKWEENDGTFAAITAAHATVVATLETHYPGWDEGTVYLMAQSIKEARQSYWMPHAPVCDYCWCFRDDVPLKPSSYRVRWLISAAGFKPLPVCHQHEERFPAADGDRYVDEKED